MSQHPIHDEFQSPIVRDLVWAITSPDLLANRAYPSLCQEDYFSDLLNSTLAQLKELDKDATPLRRFLEANSNRRLGFYFEALWRYWLRLSPDLELLAHNVAIRDNHRTLGELDFIVFNKITQQCEHWELALKFYLGYPIGADKTVWFGPGLKDRLDKKLRHLLQHQLPLIAHPIAETLLCNNHWHIKQQRLITKGRLFTFRNSVTHEAFDGFNPTRLSGQWLTLSEFQQHFDTPSPEVTLLSKQHWLGHWPTQSLSYTDSVKVLQQPSTYLPCQLVAKPHQAYSKHYFIVPDTWPEQARAQWKSDPEIPILAG